MSRLNPLPDVEGPLLRLESTLAGLPEELSALPRIERQLETGFRDMCERLDRIAELLESGHAGVPASARSNGAKKR